MFVMFYVSPLLTILPSRAYTLANPTCAGGLLQMSPFVVDLVSDRGTPLRCCSRRTGQNRRWWLLIKRRLMFCKKLLNT